MPDLAQSLHRHDLGFLRIVAYLWGLELAPPVEGESAQRNFLQQLTVAMLNRELLLEIIEALSNEARDGIEDLIQNGGRLPWSLFIRRYGAVREMGPARRDRENPHLNPASPAEILWYRALVARAFLEAPSGPQEFAYIPDDLLALLPAKASQPIHPLGRPATPKERAVVNLANDRILDHACTLLASLRLGLSVESTEFIANGWMPIFPHSIPPAILATSLTTAGLIDPVSGMPQLESARHFLEIARGQALGLLARSWLHSRSFNELRLIPGLRPEGDWQNDPLRARDAVLEFLAMTPRNTWRSLQALIEDIKETHPDFQRPAGDYDSWHIADANTGEYLRGFDNWERVDGALIRFIITGPLHWLGIVDLASPEVNQPVSAFRLSAWSGDLLNGAPAEGLPVEDESLLVSSDARLRLPRLVPRAVRYQVARFTRWERAEEETYSYRITHASLRRAGEQGIQVSHILALLRRHALTVPPNLVKALERWEKLGSEAQMERALILRLRSPEMLQSLRSSRAARFLGDPLSATVIVVKPGVWEKLVAVLAELGYIVEGEVVDADRAPGQ
ncbi:MAG: hypothetical protein A2W33_05055 [Chloroflexi bacterium RBG_16_52_11]|nr:MAG: hypothetical protein A2W33_05055 [Chloroflexi bacterium RBG_16_52_11]